MLMVDGGARGGRCQTLRVARRRGELAEERRPAERAGDVEWYKGLLRGKQVPPKSMLAERARRARRTSGRRAAIRAAGTRQHKKRIIVRHEREGQDSDKKEDLGGIQVVPPSSSEARVSSPSSLSFSTSSRPVIARDSSPLLKCPSSYTVLSPVPPTVRGYDVRAGCPSA